MTSMGPAVGLEGPEPVGESPTAYRDRWAARGGPHIPGCYLFMRGVLDPCGTAGHPPEPDRAI